MSARDNHRGDGGYKLKKYSQIRYVPSRWPTPSPDTIPVPVSRDYSRTRIGVFWDIVDCPIPDGHDPYSVYDTITSVLAGEGYSDATMEIKVYGGNKDAIPQKLRYDYLVAGVFYQPEGGRCGRVNQMLRDILIWTLDHPKPSILMVIADTISEKDTMIRRVVGVLKSRDYILLLVKPDRLSLELPRPPFVRSVWLWKDLFGGGRGKPTIDQSSNSQCACSDQSGS